jgi:hypothetical protein
MPTHSLGPDDALHFEHRPPAADGGLTFVFFNALTGDAGGWEAEIAPALRAEGTARCSGTSAARRTVRSARPMRSARSRSSPTP